MGVSQIFIGFEAIGPIVLGAIFYYLAGKKC
jgi:hypothetical protein